MWMNLYCMFLAAMTVSLAQDAPRLEIQPGGRDIRRDLGTTGYFTCRPSQQSELIRDVVWVDPRGREVPDERTGRVYSAPMSSGEGRELYVTNITREDAGEYICRASFRNQEITQKFTLGIYMSIRWVNAPREQHPVTGTSATINCVVEADPPAIVEWLDSNGVLVQSTDRYEPLDTGRLHIQSISSEDDAEFVCRAKVPSEGWIAERRVKVEVYSRPEITLVGSEVKIVESEEGSIRCQATGKPAPVRTWYGPAGTDASLVPGLTVEDGTLTIRPASRQMAGQYRCSASNAVDTVEETVDVVVIVPPEIVSYENVTAPQAESATLVCRVSGSPGIAVSFRNTETDTVYRADSSSDDRVQVQQVQDGADQVGKLSIGDLTRSDAGTYDCLASNAAVPGRVASAAARLTVQFPPVLSGPEPGEVFTWTGQPAELSCRVEAEPAAEVSWSFSGRSAQQDPNMVQTQSGDTSILTVTPADGSYYGTFSCSASNSRGSDTLDIALREATPPGPLFGVTAAELTATSVEFSIPAPESNGGLPVTTYLVQYVQQDQPWESSMDHQWSAEGPFLLQHGLEPEQTYRFRFAARNAVGTGGWSEEELEQMMPKIAAPQPPQLITASGAPVAEETGPDVVIDSDHSDSYEARWKAGADNGADIDSYQVIYYKVISRKNVWRHVTASERDAQVMPGQQTYRLTGLDSNSHYRLELRARNRIGYSEPAQVIIRTATAVATEPAAAEQHASSLVVGVVIAVLLALIILGDLTCYAVSNRGITHLLCSRARGTADSAKLTEEAASEKEPLQENGNGNKSSPPPPEVNGERELGGADEELNFDKAQLDAAKDSAV